MDYNPIMEGVATFFVASGKVQLRGSLVRQPASSGHLFSLLDILHLTQSEAQLWSIRKLVITVTMNPWQQGLASVASLSPKKNRPRESTMSEGQKENTSWCKKETLLLPCIVWFPPKEFHPPHHTERFSFPFPAAASSLHTPPKIRQLIN